MDIAGIRAAALHKLEKTLVSLEVKDGFGNIHWRQALLVLLASASKLAAPLGHMAIFSLCTAQALGG